MPDASDRRFVTLLGYPTAHSLSPAIHHASFARLGLEVDYRCVDVPGAKALDRVLADLAANPAWAGANVTMPCKQAVLPLLDDLSDAARLVGAVNVVAREGDRLVGHNSDGWGFMRSLQEAGAPVRGAHLAIVGCGGAGSAVLVQAVLDGARAVDVLVRPGGGGWRNAVRLADALSGRPCRVRVLDVADRTVLAEALSRAQVVANTTPVGMGAGSTDTPVPREMLRPGQVVADAVYEPRRTQLLEDARAHGCTCVDGLGMLLWQAARSEQIWFGVQMDAEAVRDEVF